MSYWVYLEDERGALPVKTFTEGGTYVLGGTSSAELNVTYNYSQQYSPRGFSIKDLHGKTGAETVDQLQRLVDVLGLTPDPDYWKPTPGNAGRALNRLLQWARQHPTGRWRVS